MPALPPARALVATLSAPFLAADERSARDVIIWSLVLLFLLIAGMWIVMRLKRRLAGDADARQAAGGAVGFTLSDLRRLHREGQMSDEEFERAKAKVVDAARRAVERDAAAAAAKKARDAGAGRGTDFKL